MKKLIFVAVGIIGLASCAGEQQGGMTQNEAEAKIDSLFAQQKDEIFMQAMEDLDRRISIEVKPKADSIVAAMTGK